MSDCRYNLLIDELISVCLLDGTVQRCNLPQLLVLAEQDIIADFPALRPHQEPAWHMFLVQLAVLAIEAIGGELPQDEAGWRNALRALTSGFAEDEPWCLVVNDWSKPGLLQSPLERTSESVDFKRRIATPDALDLLVTSKNHDLKAERMGTAEPEDWLYALLSLQTMEGFLGAGNYGIARMNGGFASRPMLRIAPADAGIGGQWLRDIRALLPVTARWRKQADALGVGIKEPLARLLWLQPWDGNTSLSLSHCHPLGVEVCRRLRLQEAFPGQLKAMGAGSKLARVDSKQSNGVVGDPWLPVDLRDAKKGTKAFTPTADGFGYRRMSQLLNPELFEPAFLQRLTKEEGKGTQPLQLTAGALTRGQGKTEGFHQRRILWGKRSAIALADREKSLPKRAIVFVEMASAGSSRVLRPAIFQLLDGKAEPDWKKPSSETLTRPILAALDAAIDQHFFTELDASFEAEERDNDAALRWERVLARLIREQFERAVQSLPRKGEARHLAEARARNRLEAALRKTYPGLREATQANNTSDQEDTDVDLG